MPKDSAIGGSLWEMYSKQVRRRMDNPTFRGQITEEEAKELGCELVVVDWGAEACGDMVQLFWAVDKGTNVVKRARFYSFGCGTAIASSDLMCEMCEGKTVDECLKINNLVVEHGLRDDPNVPAVPPQKMHCSVMAHDVLRKAVAMYKGVEMATLDDQEIVCACARVTVGLVRETIRLNDLTTVEQITQYTKAGAFCKSCVHPGGHEKKERYLVDILRETRAEMAREKVAAAKKAREEGKAPAAGKKDFKALNIVRKGNVVQAAIDEYVLPMLENDGGSCDVVDVRELPDGTTVVSIEYLGACAGCESAHGTTLAKIEEILQTQVDPSIKVVPEN